MGIKEIKIGDIVESVSITHKFDKDNLYFLNTSDILDGKILQAHYMPINELKGQAKKTIEKHDILFSEIRPKNKRFAYVDIDDTENYVVSTKLMVLRNKNKEVDNKYFYYCLTNESMLNRLQMRAESRICSFPQITFDTLKNIRLKIPSIDKQKKIVDKLTTMDNKIFLNNQLISFLEEYAQLLFHKWFVDFNFPDEEGKPYKDNGGEMYEVDGKMIPVGWSRIKLGEIVSLKNGLNYNANREEEPNAKIISVKHLNNNFILNDYMADDFYLEEQADDDFLIKKYDTIIARSASPGESAISLSDLDVYYSGFSIRMRPISEEYRYYVFFNSIRLKKMVTSNADGTIIKNITQQSLNNFKSVISDKIVLEKFNKVIEPILLKIELLQQENQLLEETRDLLIKKLIK